MTQTKTTLTINRKVNPKKFHTGYKVSRKVFPMKPHQLRRTPKRAKLGSRNQQFLHPMKIYHLILTMRWRHLHLRLTIWMSRNYLIQSSMRSKWKGRRDRKTKPVLRMKSPGCWTIMKSPMRSKLMHFLAMN